jgi:hypothetical protein
MDFVVIEELLVGYSAFIKYLRRNGNTVGQYIS